MSKQSKKKKRRQQRQKRQRRDKLINIFNELYPAAPVGTAAIIVDDYLNRGQLADQSHQSNTETIKQATLAYVRQNETHFSQVIDTYIENVLQGIESGQVYTARSPQELEAGVNKQVQKIIDRWRRL